MAQDIKVALTLDNKQFNSALANSEKKADKFSKNTSKGVSNLTKAFAGLASAIGIVEIVRLADDFTVLNNRLKAVTNSEEEAASALQLVKQVAQDTRSDLASVASLFSDITIATEEMGLTQQQVAQVATTFSQALKVSGADAGAAAGAIRQFGQALASGVLRGDEFNSINEANSKFMGEFAKALGVTRGELRDMAKEGVLTSDVILQATTKMADEVEAAYNKTEQSIGDAFQQLRNSVLGTVGELDEATGASDTLAEVISDLAVAIKNAGDNIDETIDVLKDVGSAIMTVAGIFLTFKAATFNVGKAFGTVDDIMLKFVGTGGVVYKTVYGLGYIFGTFGMAIKGVVVSLGQLLTAFLGLFKLRFAAFATAILTVARSFAALVIASGPVALAIGAIALAIEGLGRLIFGESPISALIDQIKELLNVSEEETSITDDLSTAIEEQNKIREAAAEERRKQAEANKAVIETEKTYADFLEKLKTQVKDNVTEEGFRLQAIKELTAEYKRTGKGLAEYTEAMKLLKDPLIDVSERLEGATDAVNEFQDAIREGTGDLQKELDQLNMTDFQKQQDDIRRDLEELRDETLADLQDELKDLDPVIDAAAIQRIKDQMNEVTAATQKAITEQQELAKEGYEASRTFEHGWNEALRNFIEDSTDEAAKAKNIFETFTKGVEDAFVNFAKTGKLSFKDLLDSMVEMLIRSQVQKLMGSLLGAMGTGGGGGGIGGFFKSIFGLAKGGPAQGGRPYIVGEEGPELFVPKTSGTVVPNGAMGGQTVNNITYITNSISAVDAKSVAQLFAENRKTLLGTVQMAQKEMPYG